MKYPDLHAKRTVADLARAVENAADELSIPLSLTAWPGNWGVIAKQMRINSSAREGAEASNRLLLANILMDAEVRYSEILTAEMAERNQRLDEACAWLEGWVAEQNNTPGRAEALDELTSQELPILYARQRLHSRRDYHHALTQALRLLMGVWRVTHEGVTQVALGRDLKGLADETQHARAAEILGAQRL